MREFTIDRSKWRCGGGTPTADSKKMKPTERGLGPVKLLNHDGFQCCLGQIAEQMGVPREELLDVGAPEDIQEGFEPLKGLLIGGYLGKNTRLSTEAMKVNDDTSIDDAARENDLALLFGEADCKIAFIGEYVRPT